MNHTIPSGRPVADAETATSESGTAYARFRLAHDRRNGAQGADREAMFINCVAFSGLAESVVAPTSARARSSLRDFPAPRLRKQD